MPKKKDDNLDDLALFHEAMKGAKPLSQKNRVARPKPVINPPKKSSKVPELFNFHADIDLDPVRGEEVITYKQSGISDKTLRKLRKGQYNVEAILDLHGMTVDEAAIEVEDFLYQCLRRKLKVALIIHGKGKHSQAPILKNKLNRWLRGAKPVLAFCSASATHGNRGAIYILLKNYVEEDLLE